MNKLTIKNIGVGLFFVLALQSCKLTQDYARPELNMPTAFEDSLVTNDSSVVEIPSYQQFFKDEKLIGIINQVMVNNPDLIIATEHILANEALLKSVKLNYLPDINLQMNASVQRLSKNSMMGSLASNTVMQEYNLSPSVSWDVDFWGKLKMQREEALSNYLSQAENRRALRVQLIAQTAQAYYNLLSLDEQLRITQSVEKSMQETLSLLKVQYAVGDVTSIAIKQSEAQLAETRALIPEINASIKAQENALQTLAGSYPAAVDRKNSLTSSLFIYNILINNYKDKTFYCKNLIKLQLFYNYFYY